MAAIRCAAAVVAVGLLASCGRPGSSTAGPLHGLPPEPDYSSGGFAHADYFRPLPSFPVLAATLDAILVGEVTHEWAGERQMSGESQIAFDHSYVPRSIEIRVDETIYLSDEARKDPPPEEVVIGDGMWEGDQALAFNGVHWVRPGERVYLLLERVDECGRRVYRDLPEVGRLPFEDGRFYGFESGGSAMGVLDKILDMSVSEFRARMTEEFQNVDPKLASEPPRINCRPTKEDDG